MRTVLKSVTLAGLALLASASFAQSARDIRGPAPVLQIQAEPPARLIVDPPLPGPLATGKAFIQYRSENLRIVQVFGDEAVKVSPRVGHIHVKLDGTDWHWADASGEPVLIVGLKPGAHKVLIELTDPVGKVLDQQTVNFTVPPYKR